VRALAFVVGVARAILSGGDALRPAREGRTAREPQPMNRTEPSIGAPDAEEASR